MEGLMGKIRGLAYDEEGQDVVEYALLAAFVALVAAAILVQMAPLIQNIYDTLLQGLQDGQS